MRVKAAIDTHIRLDENQLPDDIVEEIILALSIRNQDKIRAKKEHLRDWRDLPDFINLWHHDVLGRLILPRGFKSQLTSGLRSSGITINWDDDRVSIPMDSDYTAAMLAPEPSHYDEHQESAVRAMISFENMIYKAPPASGKTVTALKTIKRLRQRAIILVDRSGLAEQWRERIRTFLGVDAGFIGENVFDPSEITVALKQTLWARRKELKAQDFFDEWGVVVYDECHHVTAETYQFIIQQFPARFLIGISATPKRVPWTFPIATALIGPVCHETSREELQNKGILVQPQIRVLPTKFNFEFRATKINKGGYRIGNNYPQMMKSLVNDPRRNFQIINQIMKHQDRYILVVSKRLGHFAILTQMLEEEEYPNPIYRLTGKESGEERLRIQHLAGEGPSITFATVADEGVDVPRWDTLFLIWPTRNLAVIRQQIGRIERAAEGKKDAIAYHLFDKDAGVLKNQFQEIMEGVYREEELEVKYV